MAGLLGTIENFDPQTEDWTRYVKRVNEFFEVNDIRQSCEETSYFADTDRSYNVPATN